MTILKRAFDLFSSYGFAVTMILLLLVLTFFGTLEQVEHGLYDVQKKYFESLFLVHWLFGVVPIPLPGAYLVMILFSINLICGGLIRIRKNWQTPGVIIVHLGMLFMLLAGLVTFKMSSSGHMTLWEGEASDEVASFTEWAIEIQQPGVSDEAFVIPQEQFADLKPDQRRTFHSEQLPFDLEIAGFARNAVPMPVGPRIASSVKGIDGFFLQVLPKDPEAERNVAGAYVTVRDKASGEATEGILWGMSTAPLTVQTAGGTWTIDLTRKKWTVPFTVVLDKTKRDLHPGTTMAASYESEITKVDGPAAEKFRIYMNHPLRDQGYTFFQTGWGPRDARPGDRVFSTFTVVRNPADHWPLYACIVISFGLLLHFVQKLARYIRTENKKRLAT